MTKVALLIAVSDASDTTDFSLVSLLVEAGVACGTDCLLEILLSGGGLLDGLSRTVSGGVALVLVLAGEHSFLFLEAGRRSPPPF